MSIDLALPKKSRFEAKKFKLESSTLDTLKLYVQAAQLEHAADEDSVVDAILKRHFQKDKKFQAWMKSTLVKPDA